MTKENQMYSAANPDAKHGEHLVDYHIDNIDLKFTTNAGVFSKSRTDYGSDVLIRAMRELISPEAGILDVETGYDPMGLFAAKLWLDQEVGMVGVNEHAIDLAKGSAQFNHIDNVDVCESNIYKQVDNKCELIVTSPPIQAGKKVVNQILPETKEYLAGNGILLVVIQKKQGAPNAKKLMTKVHENCEILARDKGYCILMSKSN